jgi:hypothetical protein
MEFIDEFSLRGGPLQRATRIDDRAAGLIVALSMWMGLTLIALVEGYGARLFSLSLISVHVRLLGVVPLSFFCARALDPRIRAFLREIVQAEIVRAGDVPRLAAVLARIRRCNDSWLPDAACLTLAVLMLLLGGRIHLTGTIASYDPLDSPGRGTWTACWYGYLCLTLYRFLMFRWLWRLSLWWLLLYRLSRLPLHLVASHPDRMGGLGYLEVVQIRCLPLVVAISLVQSASLAEGIAGGAIVFEQAFPTILLTLTVSAVLLLGPLFFFVAQFWVCRDDGWSDYLKLATRYVSSFEQKWIEQPHEPSLLGTSDLQSLADLGNSLAVVREMQWIPISLTLLKDLAGAGLVPFVPLILLKYPVTELAQSFLKILL